MYGNGLFNCFRKTTLVNCSTTSFEDARTINGTIYPIFQAADVTANLISDMAVARECFGQCVGFSTPAALGGLFAALTLNGYPTLCTIYNDNN